MKRTVLSLLIFALFIAGQSNAFAQKTTRRAEQKKASNTLSIQVMKGGEVVHFKGNSALYDGGTVTLGATRKGTIKGENAPVMVIQFSYEGLGGGNNHGDILSVYRVSGTKTHLIASKTFDASLQEPGIDSIHIAGGAIVIAGSAYGNDDASCCPTRHHVTVYAVYQGKFKPVAQPIVW